MTVLRSKAWVLGGVAAALLAASPALAQESVQYRISFPDRAQHEMQVEARFAGLQPGVLELRMARSSPGRYALHEFAKNVYGLEAYGVDGRTLAVERPDPYQWNVREHGGEVTVRYTLYADRADGTYSQVDESHAHLNVPGTFLFARGLFERSVELVVDVPPGSGWEVATQLVPTDDPYRFTAPDVHYFMDSPLEIADLAWREWQVPGPAGPQTVRVAMHHLGTDQELDRYAAAAAAMAEQFAAVFGTYPRFDHGTYTFLACYVPWASGDGMEHRNSTVLTSSSSLADNMTGLLGTVAHEFFHAWSVERVRPASLEPFDFEGANMSRELWFAEGFTSYYDDLAMVRAGVIDQEAFLARMASAVAAVERAPGRRFFSPVEMSMQAPFVDAATALDPTNRENTFLSYYTWGSVVALGLDLTLRLWDGGPYRLDDVMRAMWRRHGDPEIPYEVADVEAALAEVTNDPAFARTFFSRYVEGREVPDFQTLFAGVGVRYGPADPGAAHLTSAALAYGPDGVEVRANPLAGSPLHGAGVGRGDVLRSVEGRAVTSAGELAQLLAERTPGDTLRLEVAGRGATRTVDVVLDTAPGMSAVIDRDAAAPTLIRRAWLARRRLSGAGG